MLEWLSENVLVFVSIGMIVNIAALVFAAWRLRYLDDRVRWDRGMISDIHRNLFKVLDDPNRSPNFVGTTTETVTQTTVKKREVVPFGPEKEGSGASAVEANV